MFGADVAPPSRNTIGPKSELYLDHSLVRVGPNATLCRHRLLPVVIRLFYSSSDVARNLPQELIKPILVLALYLPMLVEEALFVVVWLVADVRRPYLIYGYHRIVGELFSRYRMALA